jgi:hypothetical protein
MKLFLAIAMLFCQLAYSAGKGTDPRIAELPKSTLSSKALIGSWAFGESSGTKVKDSSEAQSHGEVKGSANWREDSLYLDGKSYIEAIKAEDLNTVKRQLTVAVKLKITEEPKRYGCVLSRQIESSTGEHYGLYIKKNKLGFMFNMHKKGGGSLFVKKPVELNKWLHVVTVIDGESVAIYLDGKEVAKRAWAGEFSSDFTQLVIGGNAGGKQNIVKEFFIGNLRNLQIYSYALSPEELNKLK